VRPQAHHSLRRPLFIVLLAAAALAVPAVSGAGRGPSAATLRARDAGIEAKSRAAVLGLYSLDQQLASARAHLATLQVQLATLRSERQTLQREIALARSDTKLAQRHLARRLQLLYERGRVEPLEILFGAQSLDQALTGLDDLQGVTRQDTSLLDAVTKARSSFTRASRTLSSRLSEISTATRQAAATAASLEQARAQRSAYIGSLAAQRSLNERQISHLVDVAQAAQTRSAQLSTARPTGTPTGVLPPTPTPVSSSSPAAATSGSGRTMTVVATGYALDGTTATGLPVGWGIAAVDPSVIPLGTHMTVPGYGEAVAADIGGAVVGNTIDLWFPSVAQAEQWGRRIVTITIH
jgi:3D (Asp-Asp-Asp) domain-containing protein